MNLADSKIGCRAVRKYLKAAGLPTTRCCRTCHALMIEDSEGPHYQQNWDQFLVTIPTTEDKVVVCHAVQNHLYDIGFFAHEPLEDL